MPCPLHQPPEIRRNGSEFDTRYKDRYPLTQFSGFAVLTARSIDFAKVPPNNFTKAEHQQRR